MSIDHSVPEVPIAGLKGRLDRDVVLVHNNTDLSRMQLLVQASDPHSGLLTMQWVLGTHNLSSDLGDGAVGVQRLPNVVSMQIYIYTWGYPQVSRWTVLQAKKWS